MFICSITLSEIHLTGSESVRALLAQFVVQMNTFITIFTVSEIY